MLSSSSSSSFATLHSTSVELAQHVRKTQLLLLQSPRHATDITDAAKQLLYVVKDIRALSQAAHDARICVSGADVLASYKALGGAVSQLVHLARDESCDADRLRELTTALATAIRALLDTVPKHLHSVPAHLFATTPEPPAAVAAATAALAPLLTPEQAGGEFKRAMNRLSQMLDDEISMVNTVDADAVVQSLVAPPTLPAVVVAAAAAESDPPPPLKKAPTLRRNQVLAASDDQSVQLQTTAQAQTSPPPQQSFRIAELERMLADSQARFRQAKERADRLERENEELAAQSGAKLSDAAGELERLRNEYKAFKRVSTMPAPELMASLQSHGETELELSKLRAEHDEMLSLVNAEFVRKERDATLLRQLILEPAFEGWLAKQGGGNLSRAWKDRFFVLRCGTLAYFQSESDDKPAGFLYLTDAAVERTSDANRGLTFALRTPQRTYSIAASSQQQLDAWIGKLSEVIGAFAELHGGRQTAGGGGGGAPTSVESLWRQRQIEKTKQQLAAANLTPRK